MFLVELKMHILEPNRLVSNFDFKDVTLLSLNAKSFLQNHVYAFKVYIFPYNSESQKNVEFIVVFLFKHMFLT